MVQEWGQHKIRVNGIAPYVSPYLLICYVITSNYFLLVLVLFILLLLFLFFYFLLLFFSSSLFFILLLLVVIVNCIVLLSLILCVVPSGAIGDTEGMKRLSGGGMDEQMIAMIPVGRYVMICAHSEAHDKNSAHAIIELINGGR